MLAILYSACVYVCVNNLHAVIVFIIHRQYVYTNNCVFSIVTCMTQSVIQHLLLSFAVIIHYTARTCNSCFLMEKGHGSAPSQQVYRSAARHSLMAFLLIEREHHSIINGFYSTLKFQNIQYSCSN